MNLSRVLLAALGAFVAYFAIGFVLFAALPFLKEEFQKFPAVYRTKESMMSVFPIGMAAIFIAIIATVILFGMTHRAGAVEGAKFGVLIGVFAVCGFAIHNYANLNISLKLTVGQAIAYFVQWIVVGLVIGLIYRPAISA